MDTVPPDLTAALNKIIGDLAWRGPSGKELRYVVLTREQALALLAHVSGATGG